MHRSVEVYEVHRLDFADAYLVASVERSGMGVIALFDRSTDRVTTIRREEPGALMDPVSRVSWMRWGERG